MQFISLTLPTRGIRDPQALERLLALAELADAESAWDGVWIGDSLLALPMFESMTLLAACAARTERVRLGISCQATIGLREPLLLAAQWAAVDVISAGRVTLVACPGWGSGEAVERELRALAIEHPEKVRRMERNVALLRRASVEGTLELGGELVELHTPFVQRPLPIWMAANPSEAASTATVDRLLDRVARIGDGWMTYALGPAALRSRVERLGALRAEQGAERGSAFPVCVGVNVNVNLDEREALRDARATWARYGTRNMRDFESVSAIGRPEQALERIAELLEAGATSIALYLLSERPREQVETLTEHLLPLLESWRSVSSPTRAPQEARA